MTQLHLIKVECYFKPMYGCGHYVDLKQKLKHY